MSLTNYSLRRGLPALPILSKCYAASGNITTIRTHQESALQICTNRWIAVKLLAIAINTIDHPRNENP